MPGGPKCPSCRVKLARNPIRALSAEQTIAALARELPALRRGIHAGGGGRAQGAVPARAGAVRGRRLRLVGSDKRT